MTNSISTERTFVQFVSPRLSHFKKVQTDVWNFRCPLCGDSKSSESKARGYFYRKKDHLNFICHNCGASGSFSSFLWTFDRRLHDEMKFKNLIRTSEPMEEKEEEPMPTALPFRQTMAKYFRPLSDAAMEYLRNRKIPMKRWGLLYEGTEEQMTRFYQNEMGKSVAKFEADRLRIIFPFTNRAGDLVGISGRAIDPNCKMRYMTMMPSGENRSGFGLHLINPTKTVYVFEGQIDSLFIDNAVSTGGLSKFPYVALPEENRVFVVDNQPRNKDVVKMLKRLIDDDERVVVWPDGLDQKDTNEMFLAGVDVNNLIHNHTTSGIEAMVRLNEWRKC